LAGPKSLQMQEPQDHALGRSRGGFGTKVHLVCDGHGILLAVWLTAGQRHESQVFDSVLLRAKRPRRARQRCWPRQVTGDRGYSDDGIREWLRRHHIEGVIPHRKDQPQDENFDRTVYRRRSLIEQVVGWYKECRALGTRYEKLAVDYLALWIIANIENLLKRYVRWL
jgi:transposase